MKTILVYPQSITLERSCNPNVDNYLFLEKIICEYLYYLAGKNKNIDLRQEENLFKLNALEDNTGFLIKSRINLFIREKLINVLKQHGGNLIIHEVDVCNRVILFQLIGSCINCIFKKNIVSALSSFIKEEIGDYKLKHKIL